MSPPPRPSRRSVRRLLHLLHLYVGLAAGAYFLVVTITGAALVLRLDVQRALFPHLFAVGPGPAVSLADALQSVQAAYPHAIVSGIDAPTAARPTLLAYVARDGRFLTVLVEPSTGRVLGELPEHPVIRTLQDLHFNLLAGRTGRIVNGVGATCLLAMCVTGVVMWWPGTRRGRYAADVHRAAGISTAAFIGMWAVTGIYFSFPAAVRAIVDSVSPLSSAQQPEDAAPRQGQRAMTAAALIAEAGRQMPGRIPARVVLPTDANAPVQVLFSREAPTPLTPGALELVYVNRYSGEVIASPPQRPSLGDRLLSWAIPLHVGNFAGPFVRVLWFAMALVPPLLYLTGLAMWWSRVRRLTR